MTKSHLASSRNFLDFVECTFPSPSHIFKKSSRELKFTTILQKSNYIILLPHIWEIKKKIIVNCGGFIYEVVG